MIFVTKSLAMNMENYGAIVFLKGEYVGKIVRLRKDENITIGRDPAECQVVMESEMISRKHCVIRFDCDNGKYYVTDMSRNGTFTEDNGSIHKLEKNKEVEISPNMKIMLGSKDNVILLG